MTCPTPPKSATNLSSHSAWPQPCSHVTGWMVLPTGLSSVSLLLTYFSGILCMCCFVLSCFHSLTFALGSKACRCDADSGSIQRWYVSIRSPVGHFRPSCSVPGCQQKHLVEILCFDTWSLQPLWLCSEDIKITDFFLGMSAV